MARFSLKWLLCAVAVIGLGITASVSGTVLWMHLVSGATFVVGASAAADAFLKGRRAAFSIGFATAFVLLSPRPSLVSGAMYDWLKHDNAKMALSPEDEEAYSDLLDRRAIIADDYYRMLLGALVGVIAKVVADEDKLP